jgi:hypothetical protein
MSSEFEVPIQSVSHISQAALTNNISQDVSDCPVVPVIFDDDVYHFHDVEGGYDVDGEAHVVTLIHRVQGDGSPPNDPVAKTVEIHAPEMFYTLSIRDITHWDNDYPNDDYALTLFVESYQSGPYTFHEELLLDIDKREQEFHYNE